MRILRLIALLLLAAPVTLAQGRLNLSGLEKTINAEYSYFQFVNQIVRPCASGATPFAKVEANPGGVLGNVDVTVCVGGNFRINGAIIPGTTAQNANLVFAGPASGSPATPTYRSLVTNDLPSTAVTPGAYTNANITVDAKGRLTAAANGTGGGIGGSTGSTDNAALRADGAGGATVQNSLFIIDDSGNTTTPGTQSTGDGTVAGEHLFYELQANGTDYISWLAPDSITTIQRLKLPLAANAAAQVMIFGAPGSNISQATWTSIPYDVAVNYDGVPAASSTFRFVAPRAFDTGSSFTGTVCSAGTAATAQTDFLVKVNGTTKATLRFAAAGTTCSIVGGTTTAIVATDVITIVAPASPDATLANIAITLIGTLH